MAVGPVEYLVVAFPGSRFTGAIAPALADAVASKAVRIIDLTFVYRDDDGTIETVELDDLDPDDLVSFERVEGEVTGMLNEDDIRTLGERATGQLRGTDRVGGPLGGAAHRGRPRVGRTTRRP